MTGVAVLERLSIVCPLGVRFRDEATAPSSPTRSRSSSTRVPPEQRTSGVSNNGSVFVFRNLPGLRETEPAAIRRRASISSSKCAMHRPLSPLPRRDQTAARRIHGRAHPPLSSPLSMQSGAEEGWLPLSPLPPVPLWTAWACCAQSCSTPARDGPPRGR